MGMLFSSWAHVMHGVFKPWGKGSETYMVQHLSLLSTTFVLTMGLLFKVNTVQQNSPGFYMLSVVMTLLCVAFAVVWVYAMARGVAAKMRRNRERKAAKRLAASLAAESAARGGGDDNLNEPNIIVDGAHVATDAEVVEARGAVASIENVTVNAVVAGPVWSSDDSDHASALSGAERRGQLPKNRGFSSLFASRGQAGARGSSKSVPSQSPPSSGGILVCAQENRGSSSGSGVVSSTASSNSGIPVQSGNASDATGSGGPGRASGAVPSESAKSMFPRNRGFSRLAAKGFGFLVLPVTSASGTAPPSIESGPNARTRTSDRSSRIAHLQIDRPRSVSASSQLQDSDEGTP